MVAPPSNVTRPKLTQSILSTLRPLPLSQTICAIVARITTTVASSTGASAGPTTPPATMKPSHSVPKAAAHSRSPSAYLNMPKKRAIGKKSNKIFMA